MVRIIILAGKTFRGVQHFEDTRYDASEALAQSAIDDGDAVLELGGMHLSDPDSFKGPKGPTDK